MHRRHQVTYYAGDIALIVRKRSRGNCKDLIKAEKLEINQDQSKLLRVDTQRTDDTCKIKTEKENLKFEIVDEFVYLVVSKT